MQQKKSGVHSSRNLEYQALTDFRPLKRLLFAPLQRKDVVISFDLQQLPLNPPLSNISGTDLTKETHEKIYGNF